MATPSLKLNGEIPEPGDAGPGWSDQIYDLLLKLDATAFFSVASFDAPGNGSDQESAITECCDVANQAAIDMGPQARSVVFFPSPGIYGLPAGFEFRERLIVLGGGSGAELRNLSTMGGGFIAHRGSGVSISNLTVNGRRSAQPPDSPGGALTIVKPDSLTGGGVTVAGGIRLSSPAAAGASTLNVVSALMASTPIMAGDGIALNNGTDIEIVRVSPTYTGGTTVPLTSPLLHAYGTTSYVTVYSTAVDIHDLTVYGVSWTCVEMWHVLDTVCHHVRAFDYVDAAIAFDNAGSQGSRIHHCTIEGWGRWGIGVDTGDVPATSGAVSNNGLEDNTIRVLPGGSSVSGVALGGIALGSGGVVEGISTRRNQIDISRAGGAGIILQGALAQDSPVAENIVRGGGRAGTIGIRHIGQAPSTADNSLDLADNTVLDCETGIYLGDAPVANVRGGTLDVIPTGVGISLESANSVATGAQRVTLDGPRIRGGVAAVNHAGPAATKSPVLVVTRGTVLTGQFFADVAIDDGWTIHREDLTLPHYVGVGVPNSGYVKGFAPVGATYQRTDGGAGTFLYRCTVAGSPGTWVAVA